jgi:hypothetical protein
LYWLAKEAVASHQQTNASSSTDPQITQNRCFIITAGNFFALSIGVVSV